MHSQTGPDSIGIRFEGGPYTSRLNDDPVVTAEFSGYAQRFITAAKEAGHFLHPGHVVRQLCIRSIWQFCAASSRIRCYGEPNRLLTDADNVFIVLEIGFWGLRLQPAINRGTCIFEPGRVGGGLKPLGRLSMYLGTDAYTFGWATGQTALPGQPGSLGRMVLCRLGTQQATIADDSERCAGVLYRVHAAGLADLLESGSG